MDLTQKNDLLIHLIYNTDEKAIFFSESLNWSVEELQKISNDLFKYTLEKEYITSDRAFFNFIKHDTKSTKCFQLQLKSYPMLDQSVTIQEVKLALLNNKVSETFVILKTGEMSPLVMYQPEINYLKDRAAFYS